MPTSDDRNSGDRMAQKSDPTTVDQANPFDSTVRRIEPSTSQTQLSDPPTALVRASSFVELPAGSVVGETYEIDARLGAGAMGEVYAARHIGLGKRVAIKVIGQRLSEDSAAIERFAMEARTLAQIQHPAIVAVEHVGDLADGRAYFVMEFLRGETLFERLQRGRVPLPEALHVLDQMARGLDAAHGEGVTHRDLKPENTFLVHLPGELPVVKLVDFGLAKLAANRSEIDRRTERTQSGVAIGTPMYMSPEQARGLDVDYRTDIYALGCVAYEMLLGAPPFPNARSAPELYAAHLHEPPPVPRSIWPAIPPQLDLVLFAMLAKDPAQRPTLEQFRAVIAAVRSNTMARHAPTEYVGPRAAPSRTKSLLVTAIALLALVGGITIGAVLTTRSNGTSAPRDASTPNQTAIQKTAVPAPIYATPAPTTPQIMPTPTPTPTPIAPTPPPQPRAITPRTAPKTGSASVIPAAVPADAGVDAEEDPIPPPPPPPPEKTVPKVKPPTPPAPPIDRNQTINPFAKKHKVSP